MVQLGRRALEMPGDARQDLWIIQELANRLGCGWNYAGPESGVAAVYDEMRTRHELDRRHLVGAARGAVSVTYPCRTEDDPGQPVVFTENFPTKDGRGRFVPADLIPANERPDAEYPFILITGGSSSTGTRAR
jgi:formate dehydrogenase major subunit